MEEVMLKEFLNILLNKYKGYQKTMITVKQLFIKENNFWIMALDCYMLLVGQAKINLCLLISPIRGIKTLKITLLLLAKGCVLMLGDSISKVLMLWNRCTWISKELVVCWLHYNKLQGKSYQSMSHARLDWFKIISVPIHTDQAILLKAEKDTQ